MRGTVGVTHDDIAALESGTDRRGCPRLFLPSRSCGLPVTPDKVRRLVEGRSAYDDMTLRGDR